MILLIAPIIINGLIVFFVQFFITEKFKKKLEKTQLVNETYKTLYSHLQSLTSGSLYVYLNKNKLDKLNSDIQEKNALMEKLLVFCGSNYTALSNIDWRINDIEENWDNLWSYWEKHKEMLLKEDISIKDYPSVYVELFTLIIGWQVSIELLKTEAVREL